MSRKLKVKKPPASIKLGQYIRKMILLGSILTPLPLSAFPTLDDETLGLQALHYRKKTNFWFRFDAAAVDSETTTFPPGSSYLDRRLETFVNTGGDLSSGDLGIRLNIKAFSSLQKGQEKSPPFSPKSTEKVELKPSLDLTIVNHKGLEIFVGAIGHVIPKETIKVDSEVITSQITYAPISYYGYRFGLMKRGGAWSGGFYAALGNEAGRTFKQTSSDGTEVDGDNKVQTPPEYGIVADFALERGYFELDFASVQAGEGGERTSQGNVVRDDYLRAQISGFFALPWGLGLKVGLHHQTLSYSNNAYASIDTIPVSSLKTLLLFGNHLAHSYLGFIYAYGNDGTSITEYNAKFRMQALAISLGLFYPL